MRIKIKTFRKLIRESIEEMYKKSHNPYMPNDHEMDIDFPVAKVWHGLSKELKHSTDYNEALSKVLDEIAEEHPAYEFSKGTFSS